MRILVLSKLKRLILPRGRQPRRIVLGLNRGLVMLLDLVNSSQRWLGLYESELYSFVKEHSAGINTAIDIGASDGFYAIYFLAKTSAQTVLAFEPSTEARLDLELNLRLNGLDHDRGLVLSAKFVGSRADSESVTLDSFLDLISSPCMIKIDVDGAEADVLAGAVAFLHLPKVFWIIETHSYDLEKRCTDILTQSGYDARIVPNAWWRIILPELRPIPHNRWLVAIPKRSK